MKLLNRNFNIEGIIADAVDLMNRQEYVMIDGDKVIPAIETPKGEANYAVAVAGIIARGVFLEWLYNKSIEYDIELPKGASFRVISTARILVKKYDKKILKLLGKVHFKTTAKILSDY